MLAVDLGGTRVKAGRVVAGVVSELVVVDHGGADLRGALACVDEALGRLGPADAVGMCVPGLVDDTGTVVALPGKLDGVVGFDLLGWLGERAAHALVVNDAIAYGVGEAGRAPGRTVVMTIGTGVGCCVVEDGRPLGRGPLGGGQLGGQLPLTEPSPGSPTDTSGRSGSVEAWCRSVRVLEECRAAGADVADIPACFAAAEAGDERAQRGIASYQRWLARGVAALCLAHGPDAVVIGGGPVTGDGPLLRGLQELVDPLLWPGQSVELRPARYGDAAALVGLEVLAG